MTDALYLPDPLLVGIERMLRGALPDKVNVGIAVSHPTEWFVNLWPAAPSLQSWTLHGPTAARWSFQATSVAPSVREAWKQGSLVRRALGRDSRGKFNNPLDVEGYHVMDIEVGIGAGDNAAGIASWSEDFTVLYHYR